MNLFTKALIFPIKLYQWFISPLLGASCRYTPTCSHYMISAIDEWGLVKGTWIGLKRIARCHPWAGHGHDPVPKNKAKE
ncbi:MAG: membrane protein insertion efficiency factor YidD [Saprospiraceae bacterium]